MCEGRMGPFSAPACAVCLVDSSALPSGGLAQAGTESGEGGWSGGTEGGDCI